MSEQVEQIKLKELQSWMQGVLTGNEKAISAEQVGHVVAPSHSLNAEQRLAIYQHGYYARLLQCFEGQFKALRHALGAELFADFTKEYLHEFPSQSPTLSDLGSRFANFLSANRPDAEAEQKEEWIDFMIDLARFEWELYQLFDAEGCEEKGYAGVKTPDEKLLLQPAVRLFSSGFPVAHYYREVSKGKDPVVPLPEMNRVALVRKNFVTGILQLTPAQFYFLKRIQSDADIKSALNETAAEFGVNEKEAVRFWKTWKKEWIKWGMFVQSTDD